MYTQTDLILAVIGAIFGTAVVIGVSLYEYLKIEYCQIKKESYNEGFNDGKKECPTRSVLIESRKMGIHKCEHTVEIDVNKLRMITEEEANAYICGEMMKQLTINLIPFMETETLYDPMQMTFKAHGVVKFIKPDGYKHDPIQDGIRQIYSRMR